MSEQAMILETMKFDRVCSQQITLLKESLAFADMLGIYDISCTYETYTRSVIRRVNQSMQLAPFVIPPFFDSPVSRL
jgi:hypothetical protein